MTTLRGGKPRTALTTTPEDAKKSEERFAEAIGAAVEQFGREGGSIAQAGYSLLRYAAQCYIFQGRSFTQFTNAAPKAFTTEQNELRAKAKKAQA
jgi:hypothetical protein